MTFTQATKKELRNAMGPQWASLATYGATIAFGLCSLALIADATMRLAGGAF